MEELEDYAMLRDAKTGIEVLTTLRSFTAAVTYSFFSLGHTKEYSYPTR